MKLLQFYTHKKEKLESDLLKSFPYVSLRKNALTEISENCENRNS